MISHIGLRVHFAEGAVHTTIAELLFLLREDVSQSSQNMILAIVRSREEFEVRRDPFKSQTHVCRWKRAMKTDASYDCSQRPRVIHVYRVGPWIRFIPKRCAHTVHSSQCSPTILIHNIRAHRPQLYSLYKRAYTQVGYRLLSCKLQCFLFAARHVIDTFHV